MCFRVGVWNCFPKMIPPDRDSKNARRVYAVLFLSLSLLVGRTRSAETKGQKAHFSLKDTPGSFTVHATKMLAKVSSKADSVNVIVKPGMAEYPLLQPPTQKPLVHVVSPAIVRPVGGWNYFNMVGRRKRSVNINVNQNDMRKSAESSSHGVKLKGKRTETKQKRFGRKVSTPEEENVKLNSKHSSKRRQVENNSNERRLSKRSSDNEQRKMDFKDGTDMKENVQKLKVPEENAKLNSKHSSKRRQVENNTNERRLSKRSSDNEQRKMDFKGGTDKRGKNVQKLKVPEENVKLNRKHSSKRRQVENSGNERRLSKRSSENEQRKIYFKGGTDKKGKNVQKLKVPEENVKLNSKHSSKRRQVEISGNERRLSKRSSKNEQRRMEFKGGTGKLSVHVDRNETKVSSSTAPMKVFIVNPAAAPPSASSVTGSNTLSNTVVNSMWRTWSMMPSYWNNVQNGEEHHKKIIHNYPMNWP